MFERYPKYGNSWLNVPEMCFLPRLRNEWDELTHAETPEERKSEILDMINILSMWYHSIK